MALRLRKFFDTTVASLRTFWHSLAPSRRRSSTPPRLNSPTQPDQTQEHAQEKRHLQPQERPRRPRSVEQGAVDQSPPARQEPRQPFPLSSAADRAFFSQPAGAFVQLVAESEPAHAAADQPAGVPMVEDQIEPVEEGIEEVIEADNTTMVDEYSSDGSESPHAERNGVDDNTGDGPSLVAILESLLFVAGEPVEPVQFAKTLQVPLAEVEQGLHELAESYKRDERGLRVQMFDGKVQLVTAPAAATYVESFLNLDAGVRLSGPALETLAVIAYRQPVTRAQIEAVRGVDCAGVLRSLLQRGLIAEAGRLESAGRPILYGVTELFMQHFGLSKLDELPPLPEDEASLLASTVGSVQEGLEGEEETPVDEPV